MRIQINHLFNGERHHTTFHAVSSARGLARVLDRHCSCEGWGASLWCSQADAESMGGYLTQGGELYVPALACVGARTHFDGLFGRSGQ